LPCRATTQVLENNSKVPSAQHLVRRQNSKAIAPEIFPIGNSACGQKA